MEKTKCENEGAESSASNPHRRTQALPTRVVSLCLAIIVVGLVVSLAACAPQSNSDPGPSTPSEKPEDGPGGAETTTTWWSAETDCATCHDNSVTTLASLSCEAAKAGSPEACMTCHSDIASIEEAHAKVDLSNTDGDVGYLKKSKIKEDDCLTCHNRDDLVAATAEVTALTDFQGTTVNPHEASTVYNTDGGHDNMNCGSCHKMHSNNEPPTEKVAFDYCNECHHTGVYECGTCH